MAEGTIKFFNESRQFGFIKRQNEKDLHFSGSAWKGPGVPETGMRVSFEVGQGSKGSTARNVRPSSAGASKPATTSHPSEAASSPPTSASEPGDYRFLNPYNFISSIDQARPKDNVLGDTLPPPHDRYTGLSGRLTCTVVTTTPLFVSDSHAVRREPVDQKAGEGKGAKESQYHYSYRFYEVDGKPAIPATSLRGMVRSVYEILTNSCWSVFDGDRRLEYRELPRYGNRVKGNTGVVVSLPVRNENGQDAKQGKIILCQTAKVGAYYEGPDEDKNVLRVRADGRPWQCGDRAVARAKRYRQGYIVRELALEADRQDLIRRKATDEEILVGWLKITGRSGDTNKKSEVLVLDPKVHAPLDTVRFGSAQMDAYNAVLRGQLSMGDLPVTPQSTELSQHDLVYVEVEGQAKGTDLQAVRLVRVQVPRLPYEKRIGELLESQPHLKHCEKIGSLCPACRMFGWLRHEQAERPDTLVAYSGRVRFQHGRHQSDCGTYDELLLSPLSTPKPTTTQFYLLDRLGRPNARVTYNSHGARLRGRKVYRSHRRGDRGTDAGDSKTNQNRTVRGVLRPGACFEFSVDFENLTREELGGLLYALEMDDGMVHRLGYAKPLGFGSVKLKVKKLRLLNWLDRTKSSDPRAGWAEPASPQEIADLKSSFLTSMTELYGGAMATVLADLRALLAEHDVDIPIHYPRPTRALDQENHPQFEWFVGNKRRVERMDRHDLPQPVVLPLAVDDGDGLPLIKKDGTRGR